MLYVFLQCIHVRTRGIRGFFNSQGVIRGFFYPIQRWYLAPVQFSSRDSEVTFFYTDGVVTNNNSVTERDAFSKESQKPK